MQGHLQSLTNQGFMTAMELATYRVPEDLMFPVTMEGYVVTFVAFYERGFGVPSHWFLHLLLRHYGLELYNLPPRGKGPAYHGLRDFV
jgi:hypothetical protein